MPADREGRGALIDRDLAGYLFGDAPAIGRTFSFGEEDEPFTVVGIIDELKLGGADDALSSFAMVRPSDPDGMDDYFTLTVRGTDPAAVLPEIRRIVREADPGLPIEELRTGEQALVESATGPRFVLVLLGTLAAIALALAAVGTYGVLAHAVRLRRREMGIRIALGASTGQIHQRIFRRGVALAVAGVVLGTLGASALTRFAQSLVFEISPGDPWSRAGAAALMLVVAMVACWIPAHRATTVDPLEVLKAE